MQPSFPHILAVFFELSKITRNTDVKINTHEGRYIEILNEKHLQTQYPKLSIVYNYTYMLKFLNDVEENILYSSVKYDYKEVYLEYIYTHARTKTQSFMKERFEVNNIDNLNNILLTIYYLIKDYCIYENNIGEEEGKLTIVTPSKNTRTIRYNKGWYCDCKDYTDYLTCLHVKLSGVYLKHRAEFNKF